MTPPQSPGEGTQGSLEDCTESSDQGVKNNVQDLSLMPRNIKNEGEDLEH